MRRIIIALLIVLSFLPPINAEGNGLSLVFEAHSTGGNENSMTTYSYIKEPRIQESGYTRGLKSGAFNYFSNGNKIDYSETLNLHYGNATNISNTTVSHTLNLSFEGENGISELYGAGLFPNNRGLSAWKKIRYEKSNTLKSRGVPIRDFNANKIWVDASIDMNTRKTSEYLFSYSAGAKDAVIETMDAAGWSNRTGSRRLDVEHTTLMTGNFIFTQTFQEIMPPASDLHGDWLPCCFNSTIPSINQAQWPSNAVINTLKEYSFQPREKCNSGLCGEWKVNESTKELEKTCKLNILTAKDQIGNEVCSDWKLNKSTNEWERTCRLDTSIAKDQNCKDGFKDCPSGGCPGFECIKTFNEELYESYPETEAGKRLNDIQLTYSYSTSKVLFKPLKASESGVDFDKDGNTDAADQVVYQLLVKDIGRTSLDNLTLKGTLPDNAIPKLSYKVTIDESGNPEVSLIEPEWDSTQRSFTYELGSMIKGSRSNIQLLVAMKDARNSDTAKFSVIGNAIDGSIVKDEASWLPAYEMDMDIALEKAKSKAEPTKMPPEKEIYGPDVLHNIYKINDTHLIYLVNITNPNSKPLKDMTLTIGMPEDAEPMLSYEVIFKNNMVEIANLKVPSERTMRYNWPIIDKNESKEFHILVATDSNKFDMDAVEVVTNGLRSDGSTSLTTQKDEMLFNEEVVKRAFEIAQQN